MDAKYARIVLAAALALPVAALAYSWAATHHMAQQGQEWLVPVRGYDPRDLLRGHYVQYRYDWPWDSAERSADGQVPFAVGQLCIEGRAPHVVRVRQLSFGTLSPQQTGGCAIVARATLGTRREVRGLDSGILYTSQPRALALSRQLADPHLQGLIRVRIRADGVMRPVGLEFRPRNGRSMR